jgi:hypothetical protein
MRILSVTAGAASMYCGSCMRDNAMASQLIARGHDVTLIPLYTPLRTDEANVTRPDVLFGGISIYLQHQSALFRRLPQFVDRLLDSPWLIRTFADRSMSVDPKFLGGLTLSMLDGPAGVLLGVFRLSLSGLDLRLDGLALCVKPVGVLVHRQPLPFSDLQVLLDALVLEDADVAEIGVELIGCRRDAKEGRCCQQSRYEP